MNKMKLISTLVMAMFLSLTCSTVGATIYLQGNIDVSITGFIGVVAPKINITEAQVNQSVKFMVNVTEYPEDPENNTYNVTDELRINLTIADATNRASFLLPRSIVYSFLLVRDKSKIESRPIFGYLKRLIPVKELFKRVKVVDSLLGKKGSNITVPLEFSISASTYENLTENMTLHIYTMGFLPGDADGISGKIPIIDHRIINLKVTYEKLEI